MNEPVTPSWYRPRSFLYQLSILSFAAGFGGYLWWAKDHLISPSHTVAGAFFLFVEILSSAGVLGVALLCSMFRQRQVTKPRVDLTVDVLLLAAENGDLRLLRDRIRRSFDVCYPHRTVVVDPWHQSEVESLCGKLGAYYQVGNLNDGLIASGAEFCALFDSASAPWPEFLEKTLSYFDDPQVAVVQTEPTFCNVDGFTCIRTEGGERLWNEEARFYQVLNPALDAWNAALWRVSGSLLRRSVVKGAGGVEPVDSVSAGDVEGLRATLRVMSLGGRVVMHSQPGYVTLLPESASEYFRRRKLFLAGLKRILTDSRKSLRTGERRVLRGLLTAGAAVPFFSKTMQVLQWSIPVLLCLERGSIFQSPVWLVLPVIAVALARGLLSQAAFQWREWGLGPAAMRLLQTRRRLAGLLIVLLGTEIVSLGWIVYGGLSAGLLLAVLLPLPTLILLPRAFAELRRSPFIAGQRSILSTASALLRRELPAMPIQASLALFSDRELWVRTATELPASESPLALEVIHDWGKSFAKGWVRSSRLESDASYLSRLEMAELAPEARDELWDQLYAVEIRALAKRGSLSRKDGVLALPMPYGLLLMLFRFTSAPFFQPFHRFVRRFYAGPFVTMVKYGVATLSRVHDFDIEVRHSVGTGEGFNAFGSDVDLTFVLRAPLDIAAVEKLRMAHKKLRSLVPSLGELEVFSRAEWELLSKLKLKHGVLLQFLRDIKKIGWMEDDLGSMVHPYHQYKLKSAVRRLLAKLEGTAPSLDSVAQRHNRAKLGPGFDRTLNHLVAGVDASVALGRDQPDTLEFFSHVLDELVCAPRSSGRVCGMNLELDSALILLALLPSHWRDAPELIGRLDVLRQSAPLRELHVAVLCQELVYANATPRMHADSRTSCDEWTTCVAGQLRKWASPAEFRTIAAALGQ